MKNFLFLIGFVLFSTTSFAQTGGATAGGNGPLEFHMSAGFLGISSSSSQYDLSPGFDIKPIRTWNWFQAGGEISYQKISYRGGETKNFVFSGGVTLNSGNPTGDATFISFGVLDKTGGSSYVDPTALSPDGIGYYLFTGKRFPLTSVVSLRPSIGIMSAGTTGFVIRPLAISIFL